MQFERDRQLRIDEQAELLTELRAQAQREQRTTGSISEPTLNRYARLKERQKLIAEQPNPQLTRRGAERRQRFERRRRYWNETRASSRTVEALGTGYFQLSGDRLSRLGENNYAARNTLWTPCRCGPNEIPAWGFRAAAAEAQIGGYANLTHPVLEIKGIPVLYFPYLKIPLKDRRQSGFLMPTFGFDTRSGNILSQPIFFALADHADATLTADYFERRGTRLGLEYRFKHREFSGWQVNVDIMRDRLWVEEHGLRQELQNGYRLGLFQAAASEPDGKIEPDPAALVSEREYDRRVLRDPDYWLQIDRDTFGDGFGSPSIARYEEIISRHLAIPQNTWRGSYGWKGVSFLAPRLSIVSDGETTSDHRYLEELRLFDSFDAIFGGGPPARAFNQAKAQMHLDGANFYAGLGARFW